MKGTVGHLNTIIEVPSEQSVTGSVANTVRSDEGKDIFSDCYDSEHDEDLTLSEHSDYELDEASNMRKKKSEIPDLSLEADLKRPSSREKKRGKTANSSRKTPRFKEIDMTPPDELLEKSQRKAKHYMDHKKADKAVRELIRCTALCRIVHGDGHWKQARSHANLAEGYFDLKGYAPQAEDHAIQARNIMMSGVQLSSSDKERHRIMAVLVNLHYTLGRAQAQQKKYSDAETALQKAQKIHKERSRLTEIPQAEIDDWDIKLNIALGKLSARQKKHALAQTHLEAGLRQMRKKHGKDAVELIPVYQALGRVEQSKGEHADHEMALENLMQAHSIANARYKDGNETVAETAICLAGAYANIGHMDADMSAESYYNDAFAIYQKIHGLYHEKTVTVQDELARLMIRTDKQQEGIETLKATLDAKKELYGELSSEVAETWKLIGNVHLAQGEMEKALRALKKCHNIECSLYGANNKKSKDTQRTVDVLMANPNIPEKMKTSKKDELKQRPRFNSIVNRGSSLGGTKTNQY